MSDSLEITIEVEGPRQQDGHLTLNDFIKELTTIKQAYSKIDDLYSSDEESGSYFQVTDLSHSSPARVTLRVAARPNAAGRRKPNREGLLARRNRFAYELRSIREHSKPSPEIDVETLLIFQKLVANPEGGVASAKIIVDGEDIPLDAKLDFNITRLIEGEEQSIGSLEGMLNKADFNPKNSATFWITPSVGLARVHCKIPLLLKSQAKNALEHYVRLHGRKFYRSKSNFPHRIEVQSIEVLDLEPAQKLSDLKGTFHGISLEALEEMRNEWE